MNTEFVLGDIAAIGPYFAVATGARPAGSGSVADALAGPVLDERIAHIARALSCEDRVAGSLAHQGLAALLVSPALAAAAVHGVVPRLTPQTLHWVPAAGSWGQWADPAGVAAGVATGVPAGPERDLVRGIEEIVLRGLLDPLADAVRARVAVAPAVLRGNVASSVAAALRLTAQHRPHVRGRTDELTAALLAGPLADAGSVREGRFRRHSCCLYHRVPGGGLCGDCVLDRVPGR